MLENILEAIAAFNLIDTAHAQAAGSAGGFDLLGTIAPMAVIFVAFYFLLIRPQQKKAQQQRDMLSAVTKGDRVVTAGGIIGKIHSVDEVEAVIEVEGDVRIRILKSAIVEKIPSGAQLKSNVSSISADGESKGKTKPARPVSAKKSAKDKTVN